MGYPRSDPNPLFNFAVNHPRRRSAPPTPSRSTTVRQRTLDTEDGRLQWTEALQDTGDRMRRVRGEGILNGNPISIHELEQRILHHAIWHNPFFD